MRPSSEQARVSSGRKSARTEVSQRELFTQLLSPLN